MSQRETRAAPRIWTESEVRALGVRTDLVTACAIVYGCGRTKAYQLYAANALNFPALRCGSRVVVPVAPLLRLLGIDQASAGGSGQCSHPHAELAPNADGDPLARGSPSDLLGSLPHDEQPAQSVGVQPEGEPPPKQPRVNKSTHRGPT